MELRRGEFPALISELKRCKTVQWIEMVGALSGSRKALESRITIAVDGRFLRGAICPHELPVCPGMVDLSQPIADLVGNTCLVEISPVSILPLL